MKSEPKSLLRFIGVTVEVGCVLTCIGQSAVAQEVQGQAAPVQDAQSPTAPAQTPSVQAPPAQSGPSFRVSMGFKDSRLNLTRDIAAQKFLLLLQVFSVPSGSEAGSPRKLDEAMMSSFSRSSDDENLPALLITLSRQVGLADAVVKAENEGDKTATVVVETKSKPLVLVQEGESWGVDVVETFARWNDLEGEAKVAALAMVKSEFLQQRDAARRSSCQSNLKQISLGMLQYAQDYGETLPKAENWLDKLLPYIKSERLFSCPSVSDPAGYGYAFNLNLSLKLLAAFESPSQTVSIYETSILERNMFGVGDEPAFRHQDGANYAFADGHVKWFPKAEVPSFKLKP